LLGQRLDSLGSGRSAQARRRGKEERAARVGDRRERAVGCWAELGRKQRREIKLLFFFLFKYFKAFSNEILNPLLNLNQTTQYKILCSSMNAQSCFYPYI
jgi:hypothetical protein